MKFDIFYQLPLPPGKTPAQRYQELLEQAVEADRLGFNGIWLAEIHFKQDFSTMPAPMLLLASIVQRTAHLRVGLAVNLLPLHHPVRLAEESAMLDILSGGRLEFGAGRGAFSSNLRVFGVESDRVSRDKFLEGLEMVRQAWVSERLDFNGHFYQAHALPVTPKPLQQPHPPIRVACNTAETFEHAGELGYSIFSAAPSNPPRILPQRLSVYQQALERTGKPRPADWFAYLNFTFTDKSAARVRQIAEPSLQNYFRLLGELHEPQSEAPQDLVEHYKIISRFRSTTWESLESNMALLGEPELLIERIAELQERFGMSRIVCWFETGGLSPHEEIVAAMRLFAEKVMPRFA